MVALLAATVAARAEASEVERGQALIRKYDCVACHVIPGIRGTQGSVGPPLNALAKRVYIAGILPNTPQALTRWLMDPPSVNPRTAMPNLGLSEQEARAVAAYLSTLK